MSEVFTIYHLSPDGQYWQCGESYVDFSEAYANAPHYGKQSVILYNCLALRVDHAVVLTNQRILQIVLTMRNVTAMQEILKGEAMRAKKWAAHPWMAEESKE